MGGLTGLGSCSCPTWGLWQPLASLGARTFRTQGSGPRLPPTHPVLRCHCADLPKGHAPPFLGSIPWLPVAFKIKSKLLSIESDSCSLAPQPCASWELFLHSHKYTPPCHLHSSACAILSAHSVLLTYLFILQILLLLKSPDKVSSLHTVSHNH